MFDVSLRKLDTGDWLTNLLVVAVVVALIIFLDRPKMRRSPVWRATITPLASIIGSGFLVVAPLLGFTVGKWAVVAVTGIIALSYLVGSAVRYNILNVEDIAENRESRGQLNQTLKWMGRLAKISLGFAYVIAITFYLELLGAFVLTLFGITTDYLQKLIASSLIGCIGIFGFMGGLQMLESIERYAVNIKLSIIVGLLVALALLNLERLAIGQWALPAIQVHWNVETLRKLLGAFLIVQGFETSRYLRAVYRPEHRVKTMRYAQWIAAGVYITFIALATVLLDTFETISETGIIALSGQVAFTLPILLVIGAAMSQFSAAVADTIGSGGLVEDATYGKIHHRYVYVGAMLLALGLLWSTDIFAIIAYASRAFAFYYAIQCLMAALHVRSRTGGRHWTKAGFFSLLSLLMLSTAIFAIPAETPG